MAGFPSPTKAWHNSSYPSIDPTLPSLSLAGKSAVITGGGSGIGLAISKAFALAGVSQLAILGRRADVLTKAASEVEKLVGGKTKVFGFSTDVGNQDQVEEAFSRIAVAFGGKLDVLVNNAGWFAGKRPFGTETVDEWTTAFNINIKGLYLVASNFIANAKADATIINISSALVQLPAIFRTEFASYSATKLAGSKIMDFIQAENPSLHVVELHPGQVTETEMASRAGGLSPHIDDGMCIVPKVFID